jgi:hypothetical protein
MSPDTAQVIPTPAGHSIIGSRASAAVHHREYAEISGEGDSPEDAARRLADMLARTRDSVPTAWHRQRLERAIEDVRAFARRATT